MQVRHPPEFTHIAGYQGQTQRSGVRGNQQVVAANRLPDPFEMRPDRRIVPIGCRIEGQNQQVFQDLMYWLLR